jgi:hypothetical protein
MTISNRINHYGLIGAGYVLKAVWYTEISSGTTGQITVPAGATIQLNEFASGVDALCVAMSGVGGLPTWETVEEADTTTVAVSSFDGEGNYVLSGVPSAYPVAVVFVYTVTVNYYDYSKDFLEHEIPGLGGSDTFINLDDTPAAYVGEAGKVPAVNGGETALEFVTVTADHGGLTGLSDDDHSQYLNETRHDADDHSGLLPLDHTNAGEVSNVGSNTHAQVDSHIADSTIHFVEGTIDHGSITGLADNDHNQYLLTDCSNDPLTGNLEVSKADPEIKLTDTGDNNNTRITRADAGAVAQRFNTVSQPGGASNAVDFDGSAHYIEISDDDVFAFDDFTINLWINFDNIGGTQEWLINQWETAGSQRSWQINMTSTNIQISLSNGGGNEFDMTRAFAASSATWYMITLRRIGSTVTIFANASAVGATGTKAGTLKNSSADVSIGARNKSSSFVNGQMDEIAIYSAGFITPVWVCQ